MHEAKTRLSQLVELALAGEEVVITRNGEPVARLEPVKRRRTMAELEGSWRGEVWMSADFNDELPDEFWGFDEPIVPPE